MYSAQGFRRLRNRFLNSQQFYNQRQGFGNNDDFRGQAYHLDRWKAGLVQVGVTFPAFCSLNHEIVDFPQGALGAQNLGVNTGNTVGNLLKYEQRMEANTFATLDRTEMTYQVALKRVTANELTADLKLQLIVPTVKDSFSNGTAYEAEIVSEVGLIKKDGSGADAVLGDVSTSEYEIFYATFEVPTGVASFGFSPALAIDNSASGAFIGGELKLLMTNFMLSDGNVLPRFEPYFDDISDELPKLFRYTETAPGDQFMVRPDASNGTIYIGPNSFVTVKRIIPTVENNVNISHVNGGDSSKTISSYFINQYGLRGCFATATANQGYWYRFDGTGPGGTILFNAEM